MLPLGWGHGKTERFCQPLAAAPDVINWSFRLWAMSLYPRGRHAKLHIPVLIFQYCKLIFHIPRCGDSSILGTATLHLIILTCLGPVSLKQSLSQRKRYRTTSLKGEEVVVVVNFFYPSSALKKQVCSEQWTFRTDFPLERFIFQILKVHGVFFWWGTSTQIRFRVRKVRGEKKCCSLLQLHSRYNSICNFYF